MLKALKSPLILAFLCMASQMALASVPPLADKGQSASVQKAVITPHRAVYDMSLTSVKNGSNISGVTGQLSFEWADACDGWAVQQHMKLHFEYAGGDASDVNSSELSWESKDGKKYNFNIRRESDGKETERYRGKATLADDGGTVVYSIPAGRTDKLPAGAMFPSAHTALIIQKALAGEKFFSRRVFDGSDEDGSNDVSAFINPPPAPLEQTEANPKLQADLLNQPAWPVRMAFFKINSETGEPDYEMNLSLQANGVARKMLIDYGDFSVTGLLTELEALPASGC